VSAPDRARSGAPAPHPARRAAVRGAARADHRAAPADHSRRRRPATAPAAPGSAAPRALRASPDADRRRPAYAGGGPRLYDSGGAARRRLADHLREHEADVLGDDFELANIPRAPTAEVL